MGVRKDKLVKQIIEGWNAYSMVEMRVEQRAVQMAGCSVVPTAEKRAGPRAFQMVGHWVALMVGSRAGPMAFQMVVN